MITCAGQQDMRINYFILLLRKIRRKKNWAKIGSARGWKCAIPFCYSGHFNLIVP